VVSRVASTVEAFSPIIFLSLFHVSRQRNRVSHPKDLWKGPLVSSTPRSADLDLINGSKLRHHPDRAGRTSGLSQGSKRFEGVHMNSNGSSLQRVLSCLDRWDSWPYPTTQPTSTPTHLLIQCLVRPNARSDYPLHWTDQNERHIRYRFYSTQGIRGRSRESSQFKQLLDPSLTFVYS